MSRLEGFVHRLHRRPPADGMSLLSMNYMLLWLAETMVGSFGVLFLWKLGGSPVAGLALIMLFFGIQRLIIAAVLPLIGMAYSRFGYRRVMAVSEVLLVGKLVILSSISRAAAGGLNAPVLWALIWATVFGGLFIAGYYVGFHEVFVVDDNPKHVGEQMGALSMLANLSGMIAPIFGGILIDRFGFSVMFAVATLVLVVGTIPILLLPSMKRSPRPFRMADAVGLLRREPMLSRAVALVFVEHAIDAFFWPVYLFLIVGSYTVFGAIGSIVTVASSMVTYAVGREYDRRPFRRVFGGGVIGTVMLYLVRFLSVTPIAAGTASFLDRIVSPIWWMKIRRWELSVGSRSDPLGFGVAHELLATVGTLTGLAAGGMLLLVSQFQWLWLVVPAMWSIVGSWWFTRRMEVSLR